MDLKGAPFYLKDEDIIWVQDTLGKMSQEEKVGQLFCVNFKQANPEELEEVFSILSPGGCMYRTVPLNKAVKFSNLLAKRAKIPMLIAANLEKGGNGIVDEGTLIGSPMEVAATGDVTIAEKMGIACAEEAGSLGANWAFAPIIDIDDNFHNPITNTRTFGNDVERIKNMGLAYMEAVQSRGMAATIKHFPGDGQDERDQHLVTSINSMSCEEWDRTYGYIYKACIDAGAKACMVGHILQPAWNKRLNPDIEDQEMLPGSLSKELMCGLLREHLGFNGLIVTDATTMAGFTLPMSRKIAVPLSIANGADMFLFARNLEEDYHFMYEGVKNGIINEERLNEAVTRILALKASLNIHIKDLTVDERKAREIIGCSKHTEWSRECADKAITLVKEEKGVLPITKERYRRILFHVIEATGGMSLYTVKAACKKVMEKLQMEGLEVDLFIPSQGSEGKTPKTTETTEVYDLILYVANLATKSNQTVVRIEWQQPMGANCGHYINDIPTIFVSLENPYHLFDFPRVKTYINCYSNNDNVIDALIEKLTGRSSFKGKSPIDPFCGQWDTYL